MAHAMEARARQRQAAARGVSVDELEHKPLELVDNKPRPLQLDHEAIIRERQEAMARKRSQNL